MMLCYFTAKEISKSCANKSTEHFYQSSAQKKGKSTACNGGSQPQGYRGIKAMNSFNLIQITMKLFPGHIFPLCFKIADKMLQPVQL